MLSVKLKLNYAWILEIILSLENTEAAAGSVLQKKGVLKNFANFTEKH